MTEEHMNSDSITRDIAHEIRSIYIQSKISPESDTMKDLGKSFDQFMAYTATTEKLSEKITKSYFDPSGSDEETEENIDGLQEVRSLTEPKFNTKTKVRSIASEIRDLRSRWESFSMDGIDADTIISDTNVEKAINNVKYRHEDISDHLPVPDEELLEAVQSDLEFDTYEIYADQLYRRMLASRNIVFYILYQTLIEEYSVEELNKEVISKRYRGSNNTYDFLQDLSQPTREELLERTGTMPGHVISMITENRRMRNSVTHSLHGENEFEVIKEASNNIDKCLEALSEFDDSNFVWDS